MNPDTIVNPLNLALTLTRQVARREAEGEEAQERERRMQGQMVEWRGPEKTLTPTR